MKSNSLKAALGKFNEAKGKESSSDFELLNEREVHLLRGGACTCNASSTYIKTGDCTCNKGSAYIDTTGIG